jgi:hypothetical protein
VGGTRDHHGAALEAPRRQGAQWKVLPPSTAIAVPVT